MLRVLALLCLLSSFSSVSANPDNVCNWPAFNPEDTNTAKYNGDGCDTGLGAIKVADCTAACDTPKYIGTPIVACPVNNSDFTLDGCNPAPCPPLVPSSNAYTSACAATNTASGSTCRQECKPGYTGSAKTPYCLLGDWFPTDVADRTPTCIPSPSIQAFSPTEGRIAGGQQLTITGLNFGDENSTVEASAHEVPCHAAWWNSSSSIICVLGKFPLTERAVPTTQGNVKITVNTKSTQKYGFFYRDLPFVASINPTVGPILGGTAVTITGGNFGLTPNNMGATFGGAPCVDPVWEAGNKMTCTTGAMTLSGPVPIVVTSTTTGVSLPNSAIFNVIGRPDAEKTVIDPGVPVTANKRDLATVKVTVKDRLGFLVPNSLVSLVFNETYMTSTPGTKSNQAGEATFLVKSAYAGDWKLQAQCDETLTNAVNITFVAGQPNSGTTLLRASGSRTALGDGKDSVELQVYVRDEFSNPIPNVNVTLKGEKSTITPAIYTTGPDGLAFFLVSSLEIGKVAFTASVNDQAMGSQVVVTFTVGDPDLKKSTMVAFSSTAIGDGTEVIQVAVNLFDEADHEVPNVKVELSSDPLGATIDSPEGGKETDEAGQVVFLVSSATATTYKMIARPAGAAGDLEATVSITFTTPAAFEAAKKEEVLEGVNLGLVIGAGVIFIGCIIFIICFLMRPKKKKPHHINLESEDIIVQGNELYKLLNDYKALKREHRAHERAKMEMERKHVTVHDLHEMGDDDLEKILKEYADLKKKLRGEDEDDEMAQSFYASHQELREAVSVIKKHNESSAAPGEIVRDTATATSED